MTPPSRVGIRKSGAALDDAIVFVLTVDKETKERPGLLTAEIEDALFSLIDPVPATCTIQKHLLALTLSGRVERESVILDTHAPSHFFHEGYCYTLPGES